MLSIFKKQSIHVVNTTVKPDECVPAQFYDVSRKRPSSLLGKQRTAHKARSLSQPARLSPRLQQITVCYYLLCKYFRFTSSSPVNPLPLSFCLTLSLLVCSHCSGLALSADLAKQTLTFTSEEGRNKGKELETSVAGPQTPQHNHILNPIFTNTKIKQK